MSTNISDSLQTAYLMKAAEVASILQISRALAYRLMQQGQIPTVRIGGIRRVWSTDLYELIERSRYTHENWPIGRS